MRPSAMSDVVVKLRLQAERMADAVTDRIDEIERLRKRIAVLETAAREPAQSERVKEMPLVTAATD
jgi:aspartate carbamoyltransferase catalytic subunit